jgi:hypothetical protein
MNQRIQELAKQAGIVIPKDSEYNGHIYRNSIEKFSRLIVRECMDICKKHPSRDLENGWFADAVVPDLVQQFEEHFGVEE